MLPRERLRRRRLVGFAIAGVVAIAVVLAIVAGRRPSDAGVGRAEGRATSFAALRLTSLDGKRIALPAGRPGMVMFSTSMCVTCFVSARAMAEYRAGAHRRVDAAFISLDPGDSARTLAERRDAMGGTSLAFAIDTSGALAARYGITVLGTVVVYDAAGRVVARMVEPGTDDLRAAFARAGVA
jgi:hypothetical protein